MSRRRPLLCSIALTSLILAQPSLAGGADHLLVQDGQDAPAIASANDLVAQVDIPYDVFTLDNGLTTIVHTDRKSPVVGVTVYYRVGSKHEPRGKTGFAHLFEHLMFGGSENVENFDIPLEAAGSTSTNGSTNFDRTNYVETVPTGALDLALMMESDRMGYLLGAVSQDKLDKQRGVVQNEKRQGDNQPYGLLRYGLIEGIYPVGHPYRHSTIGSLADLDAASLTDVRQWFIDNYGPNNVVLSLSGDIDAQTAREKVEQWFGAIPRGPEVTSVDAPPVTLAADKEREMVDQVPVPLIYRVWSGPDMTSADAPALEIGLRVLGGLASSRLDNELVRGSQVATSVSASVWQAEQASLLMISMNLKPGADRDEAEAQLDALIAKMIAEGPTDDELQRATTSLISQEIGALELVGGFGGKGATLAEGQLYTGDPAFYRHRLKRIASLRPVTVQQALQRWMTRPVYRLSIVPGERTEDGGTMGGWGDEHLVPAPAPDAKKPVETVRSGDPRAFPPIEPVGALTFPEIERATLSNGVEVLLARRSAVPKLVLDLEFDAGFAVDGKARAGIHSLMMDALEEGTTKRSAVEIAEEQERLGASISTSARLDSSHVRLEALTANLGPSLDLMADIALNPAFAAEDIERLKGQRLADIAQQLASPGGLAARAFNPILFGENHPYGTVGLFGETAVIEAVTPDHLRAEHRQWLRPDLARITVVGDVDLDTLTAQLERVLGDWKAPASAAPTKSLDIPTPPSQTRLVVIDRPNSPQSLIVSGRLLPLTASSADTEALDLANEVLGNGFLSRLNLLIREEKGWSYGARSLLNMNEGSAVLGVQTAVQSDRTADSIQLILDTMNGFASGDARVNDVEYNRVTDGNIRGLPNRFQTNSQVLDALVVNASRGRADDYYVRLPDTYRAIDKASLDAAAAQYLGGDDLTIVVVGDRSVIDAQLEGLDIEPTYLDLGE